MIAIAARVGVAVGAEFNLLAVGTAVASSGQQFWQSLAVNFSGKFFDVLLVATSSIFQVGIAAVRPEVLIIASTTGGVTTTVTAITTARPKFSWVNGVSCHTGEDPARIVSCLGTAIGDLIITCVTIIVGGRAEGVHLDRAIYVVGGNIISFTAVGGLIGGGTKTTGNIAGGRGGDAVTGDTFFMRSSKPRGTYTTITDGGCVVGGVCG